jgi:hypothetical protein
VSAPELDQPALALAAVIAALALLVACACGGDDGSPASAAVGPAGEAPGGGTPLAVNRPVSQFSVLAQDLKRDDLQTDTAKTWEFTAEAYARTGAFPDQATGLSRLGSWGYREGYQTAIAHAGGEQALLEGGYNVYQELHLFEDAEGAAAAFRYFRENVRRNGVSEELETAVIGDESFVSQTHGGVVQSGSARAQKVIHQVMFRRGNVVAVIVTVGVEPLMAVDTALELSSMVDAKILGSRPHPSPTPIPLRTATATDAR